MSEVDRSRWIVNLGGKDYATWPYVLDEAHKRGLKRLECELVQIPSAENGQVAIVKATAEFAKPSGENPFIDCLYTAYGDASPRNVHRGMIEATIRLAETRAKGRALRDACNIGMTLAEELPDDEMAGAKHPHGAAGNGQAAVRAAQSPAGAHPGASGGHAAAAAGGGGDEAPVCMYPGCTAVISKNEQTRSQHHFKCDLCRECLPKFEQERKQAAAQG